MNKFIYQVRRGKIKGPQQRGFSLENWKSEYERTKEDQEDDLLYQSGCWFYARFEDVREDTARITKSLRLDLKAAQRLLVGFAVMQTKSMVIELERRMKEESIDSVFIQELMNRPVKTLWGAEMNGDALNEALVDGIRFAIDTFRSLSPTEALINSSLTDQSIAAAIIYMNAISYNFFSTTWQECLWSGLFVSPNNNHFVLRFLDAEAEKQRVASLFRYEAIQSQGYHMVGSASRQENFLEHSHAKVLSARKRSNKYQIKAVSAIRFRKSIPLLNPGRVTHIQSFADELLQIKHKELCDLSAVIILEAYDLLSQIAHTILPQLSPKPAKTADEIAEIAPIIDQDELVKAFISVLKITERQVHFIIGLMTFNGSPREQLWFRPLLPHNSGQFLFLSCAVGGIQYARLLHYICARVPNFESQFLKRFETYTRNKLTDSINEGILKYKCFVYNGDLVIDSEEIDLVFSVGPRFFICELKATLFSAEPMEQFREKENLHQSAIDQIFRKIDAVERNRREFLNKIKHPFLKDADSFSVHPVVITNNQYQSGFPHRGVPIIDDLILARYFDKGYIAHGRSIPDTGELEPINKKSFYKNMDEGISNFSDYIFSPPQTTTILDLIKLRIQPVVGAEVFYEDYIIENIPHDS